MSRRTGRKNIWREGLALAGGVAIAISGLEATVAAIASPAKFSQQIAQLDLDERLCRQVIVENGLAIFEDPDPDTDVLGGVGFGDTVTLIERYRGILGPDGNLWVQISEPVGGFIINGPQGGEGSLAFCGNRPIERPIARVGLCRQVDRRAAPDGLIVRASNSALAERVDGIESGGRVTLIPDYTLLPDRDGADRNWVEISAPTPGFVSASALIFCQGPELPAPQSPQAPFRPRQPINLCRLIDAGAAPEGVVVRANAGSSFERVGGIAAGTRVTLVEDFELIADLDGADRDWVEVSAPVPGFISANALILCP